MLNSHHAKLYVTLDKGHYFSKYSLYPQILELKDNKGTHIVQMRYKVSNEGYNPLICTLLNTQNIKSPLLDFLPFGFLINT